MRFARRSDAIGLMSRETTRDHAGIRDRALSRALAGPPALDVRRSARESMAQTAK